MNLHASQPLLDEVGAAMVRSSPPDWRRITLGVTAAANLVDTTLDVELTDGSHDTGVVIDDDGSDAVEQLREAMYQDGKGTWYNATLVVDDSGELDAAFDYDTAPFGGLADDPGNDGSAAPELLIEDHRMYPRDEALLPPWHPARTAPA